MAIEEKYLWKAGVFCLLFVWVHVDAALALETHRDRVIAVVNGEAITESDRDSAVLRSSPENAMENILAGPADFLQNRDSHDRDATLQSLVDRRLQLQAARQKGIAAESSEVDNALQEIQRQQHLPSLEALEKNLPAGFASVSSFRQEIADQITLMKLLDRDVRSKVVLLPDEIAGYYDSRRDDLRNPPESRLSMIYLGIPHDASPSQREEVRKQADDVLTRLKNGEDFSTLARRFSQGPEAAAGGDIGYLKGGDLLPELESAARALHIGEPSNVLSLTSGFYILKITDRKNGDVRPFEDARPEIEDRLLQQKYGELYQSWIRRLRAAAFVEIRP
jgi:peptidyl-prolyl cis-trans isomerase SurA